MKHHASSAFWSSYDQLPIEIQRLADKNFELLKIDSSHPSLQFKKVGKVWSARIGIGYRALAELVAPNSEAYSEESEVRRR
ncbi:MAG: hypothetical protein CTY19_11205 [Methylomonas sp.]|nr:MAG: hypothetical protein CTY19_11205 [Methylomonas sp.]